MFKAITCLLSIVTASVNKDFEAHLKGQAEIDKDTFIKIYQQFDAEFSSPHKGVKFAEERINNFAVNLKQIVAHNSNGRNTYEKGINAFTDMTFEEFSAHFHLADVNEEQHCSATNRQGVQAVKDAPVEWDWRDFNGVTPVKNQGNCGSCWTFSTTGTLEAHSLIKYKSFDSLSEQQLVDCAGAYDNHGCNGGLPSHAFEYISAAGGISTEAAYPYFAANRNCTVKNDTFALQVVGGSVNITEGDEVALKNAVFAHGPVSIAFQVVDGFRDYTRGIYSSDICKNGTGDVNHAVVAVGYGIENDIPYWLIKNSWGLDWGNEGYFKIERGINMCGVAMCNSFPQDIQKINSSSFLQ